MKSGTRLYINVTNKCNVKCPFCCMYSSPSKNTFIDFMTYKSIIDECNDEFELQLEGGEPLLHKNLFLFIYYALYTNRCKKIIILSNGIEMDKYMKRFVDIANYENIEIEFKLSINEYLESIYNKLNKNIYEYMSNLIFSIKYIKNISIKLNVRTTHENREYINNQLNSYGLSENSNVFYLQTYGRMSNNKEYEKPIIVQNIDNWKIYASDGKCFEQDLILRSEYEKDLE